MSAKSKNQLLLNISTYTIALVASVINSSVPPEKPQEIEWDKIIEFARSHCLLNIVSYAVEKLSSKPDAHALKFLHEFKMQKIIIEAQQEIEADDAMQKLAGMGVRHMPLKGYIVKNLYPSPDMRTMGDIDILVDAGRCDEVVESFKNDGFSFCGEGDLHSNVERGNAYIEFHRSLVDEGMDTLRSYYGDGFNRTKKCSDYPFRYEFSPEDMYIFLIAHIAKHYRNGGTGIRSLLDLYVYRRAYPSLDENYIVKEMKKIGLDMFCLKMEKIAGEWFGGSFSGEYNSVSAFIALGGVYGLKETSVFSDFILENDNEEMFKTNRLRWIIREFFPERKVMAIRYPVLSKHKWLTPLFWIVRAFDTLIHEPKNIKGRVEDSIDIMKIDSGVIDAQNDAEIDKL